LKEGWKMKQTSAVFVMILVALPALAALDASAMPPHPDLQEKMKTGDANLPWYLLNSELMQQQGVDRPSLHPVGETYPTGTGPVGTFRVLVLLVDFTDNVSSVNASFFDTLGFEEQFGTIRDYYQEVSYGTLDIVTVNLPSTTGWYAAPNTYSYYVNAQNGLGAYPQNSQKLVQDLVALADPVVDFSQYDNDSDGDVDALIVVHAGPGAELTGSDYDIWSHKWSVPWPWTLADGVNVKDYTMQPEYWLNPCDMTCGVFCHELGHVFGLPDVYDTDYSSYGIGQWSLMAGGGWNGWLGNSPAHPDAWCMTRLGYTSAVVVSSNITGAQVAAIETSPFAYRLWTSGSPGNEYFLVSNRQRTGYDSALPYHGLLIWHVDESVSDYGANDREWYPGHTAFGHYKVALEQSDGLWQLEKTIPFGSVSYSNDPYPGILNRRTFDDTSLPNSRSYADAQTHVSVVNVSNSKDTMTCDFYVSPAGVEDESAENTPSDYTLGQNHPNPFNPLTRIEYSVYREAHVKLEIFNLLGRKLRTLVDEDELPGTYTVSWDGTDDQGGCVSTGVYIYRLKTDTFQETHKMTLLK
jgi:immune inhibitor A